MVRESEEEQVQALIFCRVTVGDCSVTECTGVRLSNLIRFLTMEV